VVILKLLERLLRMKARRVGLCAAALLLVAAGIGDVSANDDLQAPEYRVKAAFVYKFGDYIEWPASAFADAGSPLNIGVIGADALADELARVSAGRTIGGRAVKVRRLRPGDPLAGLQMIFIGRSSGAQLAAMLGASKGLPALTVTESEDGLKLGSMINFVVVADKVRFDVGLAAAEASRLKISSRLLAVARKVVP
jgi:hypothetical protein